MSAHISEVWMSQLSGFVAGQMGLHFPRERWEELEQGMVNAARELDFPDVEACIQWLMSSQPPKNQVEILASYLTVGETYFFREKKSFEILEERILPDLIRSRWGTDRGLRIWSAGCCTGEEPYSIAISLSRVLPDWQDGKFTILATDINPHFLQKASAGVYKQWSFRDTPKWVQQRYFKRTKEGHSQISPAIRKMVRFSYLNLMEDSYPSLLNNTNAQDVIFCRNVLIYFGPEQAKKVVHSLSRALGDGGWLFVSATDLPLFLNSESELVTENYAGVTLCRRGTQRGQSVSALASRLDKKLPVFFPPPLDSFALSQSAASSRKTPALQVGESELSPPPPPPHTDYAEALSQYEQGRYVEGAEILVALLAEDHQNARAMGLLARVYANLGRLSDALAWSTKAVAADRLDPGFRYLRAVILQEQGMFQEARVSLNRALYLDPDFVLAHFALGMLEFRQGKFRQAGKHLENALRLLGSSSPEEILPESEGFTKGRLMQVIQSTNYRQTLA